MTRMRRVILIGPEEVAPQTSKFNVGEVFDTALETKQQEEKRRRGVYHPSAMAGCARHLYYERIEAEQSRTIGVTQLRLFAMGHAIHEYVQNMLIRADLDLAVEVAVDNQELKIYGHCDGLYEKKKIILEIKTVGASTFNSLSKPKKDHIIQVHCYMQALGCKETQLFYINRDTGATRVFTVMFSDVVWGTILDKIRAVEEAIENGIPPARTLSSYECYTCPFKKVCAPAVEDQ